LVTFIIFPPRPPSAPGNAGRLDCASTFLVSKFAKEKNKINMKTPKTKKRGNSNS
jgi:hypothetical protein